MASTLHAASMALDALLTDEFADEIATGRFDVTYGPPGADEAPEVVAQLGFGDADEEWAALGQGRSEERYALRVVIKVHHPDADSAKDVQERAFELYDRIRDAVAADVTLGGTVRWAKVRRPASDGVLRAAGGGWGTYIELDVACAARIQ